MNYYNEYDKKAAAWLRELIKVGAIPDGHVDERSIADVHPSDLRGYTQCHFFAGIGGWSYALQLAGWPPDRPVWTGSCPCQPFSTAGKGLAQADERHLWPVFFGLIRQCRPEHVFGEQVASAIGHGWLDGVSADLEAEGYACGATVLGAHSVNSPHQRQRLYWVAHSECGQREEQRIAGNISRGESQTVQPASCGSADGWKRVSFAGECLGGGGENEIGDICSICGLDYCNECECPGPTQDGYEYEECEGFLYARWVGDSIDEGSQGHIKTGDMELQRGPQQDGPVGSAGIFNGWDDFQISNCRDGKARRIPTEPAFFPLAHGIPARVVRLRGYGNAIVPQCAAEFIAALMDIEAD